MLRLTSSPKHNIKNVLRASTREWFIDMTMVIIQIWKINKWIDN